MKRSTLLLGGGLLASLLIGFTTTDRLLAAEKAAAGIKITVPADAVIEVDGVKTKQTGTTRYFVTPPLEQGKKYAYTVKVTYTKAGGVPVTTEQNITVEAGKDLTLDFSALPVEEPKKEPAKEEPKKEPAKEEPKKEQAKEKPKKDPAKEEAKKKDQPTIVVPYVPTPQKVVDEMLKLAGVKEGDVVYDLGCGDGRIVVAAVKDFKAKEGWGVDLNPERVKDSLENAKKAGVADKVKFEQGDVLKIEDVSKASVVTLYLLPEVNLRLAPMLKKTLKPGSRIVSHDFNMGDWNADKKIEVVDDRGIGHTIYLWTIPEAKKPEPMKPLSRNAKFNNPNVYASLLAEESEEEPKEEPKKKEEPTIVVPYVPTPQKVVDEMLKLAGVKEGDVVYDLGCGDGRIVVTAVKNFKAKEGWGVDLNPDRVKDSQENAKKAGVADKVKFEQGDVLKIEDVSKANVVTLYLLPRVNLLLAPMLKKTLKPGSRIVSHDFDMGDWKADKMIEVQDERGISHKVYLWTIGEPKPAPPEKQKQSRNDRRTADPDARFLVAQQPGEKTIVVPYVPTPQKVVVEMLKLAAVTDKDVVCDLGCGDGRIVITAVKQFKAKQGWGVELNAARVKDCIDNAKKAGVADKTTFEEGDVMKIKDVSKASVVTMYLLPDLNLKLAPMLRKTLKPGSRVVSHEFHMGDWKPDKKIEVVDDDIKHTIYLWTIPEKK